MANDGKIYLHPKHGAAPVLTMCSICHEETGVALTGRDFNKLFPNATEPSSDQRLVDPNPCTKCSLMLENGATAFISDDGRSFMIHKAAAERMEIPTGKIFKVENAWMDKNQPPGDVDNRDK